MGGRKARRPPASSADLPPNECPNCGGPLEFEANLPEGLCSTCGIYVELLKAVEAPAEEAIEPSLDPDAIESAIKRDLEQLSRAYGLKTSGKKLDLTSRLRRYLKLRDASIFDGPESQSERAIARRAVVLFLLSLGVARKAAEAMASLFGTLRALQRAAQDDLELLAGVTQAEAARIRDALSREGTVVLPERTPPPPEEAKPEPVRAEKPEPVLVARLEPVREAKPEPILEASPPPARQIEPLEIPPPPTMESEIQLVLEPPQAVDPAAAFEPEPRPSLEVSTDGPFESTSFSTEAASTSTSRFRRDRWLLYAGTMLQAIGGFGLILGSLLHDVFRVPVFGRNYASFGSMNAVFAVVGVILLMAGLAAIGFSLRGGVARPASATEV